MDTQNLTIGGISAIMAGRGRDTNRYYLHWGKQGKHIEGHNNYTMGRSPITISKERLEQLFKMN